MYSTKVFDQVISYLRQLRDVYGNELWADVPKNITAVTDFKQLEATLVAADSHASISVSEQQHDSSHEWAEATTLEQLEELIHDCMACPLGATRTKFVFGSGNPHAEVLVVGEAPGADEDQQGLPFVGRAGQLLTKILESIDLSRESVYICNILKCRPPNNRKPQTLETDSCEPYLWKQIELVQPRFILALGLTAANTLLKNKESMGALRGKIHDYHGIKTLVTYHPAALLRNPAWKKETWEDVKHLRTLLNTTSA